VNIWPEDFIYGEFRASDMGLIPGRFDGTPDFTQDEIGMSLGITEEFIGGKPVPVHISTAHNGKLLLNITLVKNPCVYKNDDIFNEYELRSILRKISKKYQWTRVINSDSCEDIWFRCIVDNVSYNRLGNAVHGVTLSLQCDSLFGYSNENKIVIMAKSNEPFYIFNNTDDLEDYVLPYIVIKASSAGNLTISNLEDERETLIENVDADEVLTMDCKNKILTSSEPHDVLLNDFNMNWIRLLPDKNTFTSNMDCSIEFTFRVPRKVGVVG
jgi:phage-related protein